MCLPSDAIREAQEYWSGEPILSPVDIPDPGIEPEFPALQADSSSSELPGKPHQAPLSMEFSRQEYWSGFPFPSPVDHILSDLSTMTCPSWVAPWAWLGFIEFDKAVVLV